jgi:hypothetical protein
VPTVFRFFGKASLVGISGSTRSSLTRQMKLGAFLSLSFLWSKFLGFAFPAGHVYTLFCTNDGIRFDALDALLNLAKHIS